MSKVPEAVELGIKPRRMTLQALPPQGKRRIISPVTVNVYKLVRPRKPTFSLYHLEATRRRPLRGWRQVADGRV